MKKTRKRQPAKRKARATAPSPRPPENADVGRRGFLRRAAFMTAGAAVVGGVGFYVIDDYRATAAETDLARIGAGVPTVVQVHDPNCPTCRALQKEARAAMDGFGEGEIQYLVANLATETGRRFAARHGVGKVTLLVFDRNGRRRQVLSGPNTRERLRRVFAAHAKRKPKTPEPPKQAPATPPAAGGAPTS